MELAPYFWVFMLRHLFGVRSQRLATQIWRHYPASQTLRWQLQICDEPARTDLDIVARIKRLGDLLSPALMLRAAEALVEPGKVRPRELTQFQERVLAITDKSGQWRW
jgi:hypothetical protein